MTIISKQKKKYPMPIYADYHFYHFYHFKTKVKISNANLCPCIFLKKICRRMYSPDPGSDKGEGIHSL